MLTVDCHRPNLEKMFYNALIKFRDEQLENYHGQPLEYSASDYHHISRPAAALRAVAKHSKNGRLQIHSRRRSQFSILTEVSRHSSIKEPKSSASYDPFRASRSPVANPKAEYASVTIHRTSPAALPPTDLLEELGSPNPKHPAVRRVQAEEANCTPSPSVEIVQWNRKRKPERSFHSKSSLATSRRGVSPASGVRLAGGSYKRNVSFRHIRKRSRAASSAKSETEQTKSQYSLVNILAHDQSSKLLSNAMLSAACYSSPALPSPPALVRSSDVVEGIGKDLDIKKIRDCSAYWKEETRKVSDELGQICEEAFNRSSVSTGRTLDSSIAGASTATSMSIHEEVEQLKSCDRELSELTLGLSGSYTVRELAETRRKLIEHSTKTGSEGLPDYLKDVILHLDRLIEQDTLRQQRWIMEEPEPHRRVVSEPVQKSLGDTPYLPSISEEFPSPAEGPSGPDSQQPDHQTTSESSRRNSTSGEGKTTIRIVPKDSSLLSIDEVKPLTIRKRNAPAPLMTGIRCSSAEYSGQLKSPRSRLEEGQSSTSVCSAMRYNSRYYMSLEPIEESPRRSDARGSGIGKWSWFCKHKSQIYEERSPTVSKDETSVPTEPNSTSVPVPDIKTPEVSEVPVTDEPKKTSRKTSGERAKSGFLKLFGKKKTDKCDPDSHKGKCHLTVSGFSPRS
jgi:serine/threonine-protein kinase HSL1 (negative regulator of Swe1 kinase)